MQPHLHEIAKHIAHKAHGVVLMDRAGWRGAGKSIVPKNPTVILPPPKSPEPNPVENIRQYLPSNDLSNRVSAMTTPLSMLLVTPGTRRSIRHGQSHQPHAGHV